jgi:hypothetical protein
VRDSLDFGGLSDRLIDGEPALAVNEVRGKNGVDQRRLSETGLSCTENCQTWCVDGRGETYLRR